MADEETIINRIWEGTVAAAKAAQEGAKVVGTGVWEFTDQVVNPNRAEHPSLAAVMDNASHRGEAIVQGVDALLKRQGEAYGDLVYAATHPGDPGSRALAARAVDTLAATPTVVSEGAITGMGHTVDTFIDAEATIMRALAQDAREQTSNVKHITRFLANPNDPAATERARAAARELATPTIARLGRDPEVASAMADIALDGPQIAATVTDAAGLLRSGARLIRPGGSAAATTTTRAGAAATEAAAAKGGAAASEAAPVKASPRGGEARVNPLAKTVEPGGTQRLNRGSAPAGPRQPRPNVLSPAEHDAVVGELLDLEANNAHRAPNGEWTPRYRGLRERLSDHIEGKARQAQAELAKGDLPRALRLEAGDSGLPWADTRPDPTVTQRLDRGRAAAEIPRDPRIIPSPEHDSLVKEYTDLRKAGVSPDNPTPRYLELEQRLTRHLEGRIDQWRAELAAGERGFSAAGEHPPPAGVEQVDPALSRAEPDLGRNAPDLGATPGPGRAEVEPGTGSGTESEAPRTGAESLAPGERATSPMATTSDSAPAQPPPARPEAPVSPLSTSWADRNAPLVDKAFRPRERPRPPSAAPPPETPPEANPPERSVRPSGQG